MDRYTMSENGLLNYTLLHLGDERPAVGVLQKLLNRNGARLVPDGVFGHHTEIAVRDFQRQHMRDGLKIDGVVGEDTWPILTENDDLLIVDCVDVFDATGKDNMARVVVQNLHTAKQVHIGGACNGVDMAVTEILRVIGKRKLFLLRFHGHGRSGSQSVSQGINPMDGYEQAIIEPGYFFPAMALIRLENAFGPYGCVELKGCKTASGPVGLRLLRDMAHAIGVPVTAGIQDQSAGTSIWWQFKANSRMFGFQGPTRTAIPGGGSLRTWCKKLPDFRSSAVRR